MGIDISSVLGCFALLVYVALYTYSCLYIVSLISTVMMVIQVPALNDTGQNAEPLIVMLVCSEYHNTMCCSLVGTTA